MRCISAYLWELREVHKKIQNEPLTNEEQEEIIHAYNQVVNLCRTADTSGIEIFDMQRMKLNQKNCERIGYFVSLQGMLLITRNQDCLKKLLFHAYLHSRSPRHMRY